MELSEELLVEIFSSFFTSHPRILLGPGDDATVLAEIPGRILVFSIDAQFENIHFDRNLMNLIDIGHRALASSLSDLAAMAALPITYLVNIEFPIELGKEGAKEIYQGFKKLNEKYCISPSGGNVVKGERLSLVIAVVGESPREKILRRKGVKDGDRVILTGDLGRSLAGYKILKNPKLGENLTEEEKFFLKEKFLNPWPRIYEMFELSKEIEIHGAIDISDGLGMDLFRVIKEDYYEILIDADKLPITSEVIKLSEKIGIQPWELAVMSGEEYEVIFFTSEKEAKKLERCKYSLTDIGIVKMGFKPDVKIRIGQQEISIKEMGFDQIKSAK